MAHARMVQAGNCRQFVAVFRCVFCCFSLVFSQEIPEFGERSFSQFFVYFLQFLAVSRFVLCEPLSAYH